MLQQEEYFLSHSIKFSVIHDRTGRVNNTGKFDDNMFCIIQEQLIIPEELFGEVVNWIEFNIIPFHYMNITESRYQFENEDVLYRSED